MKEKYVKLLEDFLKEYESLCEKFGVFVGACGCCDSPWVTMGDLKEHMEHLRKASWLGDEGDAEEEYEEVPVEVGCQDKCGIKIPEIYDTVVLKLSNPQPRIELTYDMLKKAKGDKDEQDRNYK